MPTDVSYDGFPWSEYLATPKPYKPILEACLLTEIVRTTNASHDLDQSCLDWRRCQGLLLQNRVLCSSLLKCWEKGDFSAITESPLLRAASNGQATNKLGHPGSGLSHPILQSNYYGTTHTIVHGNANTYYTYNYRSTNESPVLKALCTRDHNEIQNEIYSRRIGSTGDWFIQSPSFKSWAEDPETKILWCPGMPGVGKTVIAAVSVNFLRQNCRYLVCVVYLDYKRQGEQSICQILRAIMRQLGEANHEAHNAIEDYLNGIEKPTDTQIFELWETLSASLNHAFIVLDALDEFLEIFSREIILELLRVLGTPNVKIMVTSRVIGSAETIFDNPTTIRCEVASHSHDIEQYIRARIAKDLRFASSMTNEIVCKVLEATKERFLLAELHMNSLCRLLTIGHIRKALNTLVDEVDPAYAQVLDRIDEQDEPMRDLAKKTLTWVAYAHEPLSFSELQLVLAASSGLSNDEDMDDYTYPLDIVCTSCAGLVVLDSSGRTLRLIHFTAQEFFRRIRTSRFADSDLVLTKSIVSYLCHIPVYDKDQGYWAEDSLKLYSMRHLVEHLRSTDHVLFTKEANRQTLLDLHTATTWVWKAAAGNPYQNYGYDKSSVLHSGFGLWNIEYDDSDESFLIDAVTCDLPHLLKMLLDSGQDINTPFGTQRHTPLTIAVWCGSQRCVEILLHHPDVRADWEILGGFTPLSLAVMTQNESIVAMLVGRQEVDVNKAAIGGVTPLMLAASRRKLSILQALADVKHIDYNVKDTENGFTALFHAISSAQIKCVEFIVTDSRFDKSANILDESTESTRLEHTSPLSYAIEEGYEEIIRFLRQTEEYDLGYRSQGRTLLSFAVEFGILWLVEELIKADASTVDLPDDIGRAPLSYCMNVAVAKLLFEAGHIQVHRLDIDGRPPLTHILASEASYEGEAGCTESLVSLLLQKDPIDLNLRDNFGRTPLSYVVNSRSAELLLSMGADVNVLDNELRSPLSYAIELDSSDVARLILNRENVDVNVVDTTGRTPISYAARMNRMGRLQALLEKGAVTELDAGLKVTRHPDMLFRGERIPQVDYDELDIDRPDTSGCSLLLLYAIVGDSWGLERALDKGANPNARDKEGRTGLSYLAEDRQHVIWGLMIRMHKLLVHGADINAIDDDGMTPLDYAWDEEIMLFLIMRGGLRGKDISSSEEETSMVSTLVE